MTGEPYRIRATQRLCCTLPRIPSLPPDANDAVCYLSALLLVYLPTPAGSFTALLLLLSSFR